MTSCREEVRAANDEMKEQSQAILEHQDESVKGVADRMKAIEGKEVKVEGLEGGFQDLKKKANTK